MSIRINVNMSKIMHMPIKLGIHMYMTYANCPTLRIYTKKLWYPFVTEGYNLPEGKMHL